MAYHKPIPESSSRNIFSGGLRAYVQVEKLGQIALVLPCAVCIGWLGGAWLDQHFQQHWMTIVGFLLGCVAGMTSAIRMALDMVKDPKRGPAADKGPNDSNGGVAQ
jgi:ATP synthase protein I